MKVGILTYHSSDNYGSVLQAYALQRYLSTFFDCEVIDYRKKEVKELYAIFKPLSSRFNIITDLYNMFYLKKLLNRKQNFEEFRKNEINLSKKKFAQKVELESFVKEYDMLICGSDQVWNFNIVDFDTSFMLDFSNYTGKRVSYAASCGPKEKSSFEIEKYRAMLENFDRISVREETTQKMLADAVHKNVQIVVDPVFLTSIDDWKKLSNKSRLKLKNDYIFCYFPGGVSKSLELFSKKLAKNNNCKRIVIMPDWKNAFRSGEKYYECGPYDFLNLIINARYVCTNSFHGTAFCTLAGVPFYVEMGNDSSDGRIIGLLKLLGFETKDINYNEICIKRFTDSMNRQIELSKDFLRSLKNEW